MCPLCSILYCLPWKNHCDFFGKSNHMVNHRKLVSWSVGFLIFASSILDRSQSIASSPWRWALPSLDKNFCSRCLTCSSGRGVLWLDNDKPPFSSASPRSVTSPSWGWQPLFTFFQFFLWTKVIVASWPESETCVMISHHPYIPSEIGWNKIHLPTLSTTRVGLAMLGAA